MLTITTQYALIIRQPCLAVFQSVKEGQMCVGLPVEAERVGPSRGLDEGSVPSFNPSFAPRYECLFLTLNLNGS